MKPDELRAPANIEAERAVLGGIMLNNARFPQAAAIVTADDFLTDGHRRIWRAMAKLAGSGPIDLITLKEALNQDAALTSYAADLADGLPNVANIEHHARTVARTAALRRFAHSCEEWQRQAFNPRTDIGELETRAAAGLAELQKANRPADVPAVLSPARQFMASTPADVDWMVQGVIERGANGFFCAVPKGGKSWAAVDLCLCLAMGVPWLGFDIPRPFRVALISREDNPSLTGWRMRHLLDGKGGNHSLIEQNLYVNSRAQTPEFLLDNPEQWLELVDALKQRQVEFCVFDVFNVMHAADENDNSEMRQVLRQLSAIQAAVCCGIGVVHHYSKSEQGNMTQRLRGASAIAGWAEWLIGISMADEDCKTRRMDFELKAAQPPDSIYYQIQNGSNGTVRLELTEAPAVHRGRREGSAAEQWM